MSKNVLIYAIAALLAIVICIGLMACGNTEKENNDVATTAAPVTSQTKASAKSDVLLNAYSGGEGQNGTVEPTLMTKEEALEAALAHVGLSREEVFDVEIELEEDDGKLHYDVDFRSSTRKFEYEIEAYYGDVIKAKRLVLDGGDHHVYEDVAPVMTVGDNTAPATPPTTQAPVETAVSEPRPVETAVAEEAYISLHEAKFIALIHAEVDEANVRDLEIEFDRERGIAIYEISFESGNLEYEYEVDAINGDVLKSEKEIND